jgi:hypothetical protein
MPAPIYEPSEDRVLANHEYRTQQLERRPQLADQERRHLLPIYDAPRIMAGVYDKDYEDPFGDFAHYGFSLWPGGLVTQALLPFAVGPTTDTGDNHQLLPVLTTALVTQQAASKAAAAVCFEFAAEAGGLQTSMLVNPHSGNTIEQFYRALLGIKLLGTPRNIGISLSATGKSDADFIISSASGRWGLTHFGLFEMDLVAAWSAIGLNPGDELALKVWADGAGANVHLSHIYWIPQSGAELGPSDAPGHFNQFMGFGQYVSATATSPSPESATGTVRADNQYLGGEGIHDPLYVVSFGGKGFAIGIGEANLRGIYDSDFEAARIFEPRHMYQECRIAMATRTEHSVGYAVLYKDLLPIAQVPVHSQDWGLVYWGPWHHDFQNLHWGLWTPDDILNGGTYFEDAALDDADFQSVRMSEMWFPRDIFKRPIRYVDWP